VIGFLYITRGTSVEHGRGVGADGRPASPEEPQFPSRRTPSSLAAWPSTD